MIAFSSTSRRILSTAVVAGAVFLGARVFQVESADCEIVFRFREPQSDDLVELGARLFDVQDTSESLGEFRKYYDRGQEGPVARWPLMVSAGEYSIVGEIVTRRGAFVFSVDIELSDRDAQSVYLDRFIVSRSDESAKKY